MIDHMIMNSKKYWEGDMPCYVGKTFKSPTSPVDKWKTNTDDFYYVYPAHESVIPSGPILGQVEDNDTHEIFLMGGLADHYYLVKLTDLIQNGGVSASLNHVYHALTAFRSEVKSMIDHLLINLKKYYEGNEKNYIGKTINGVQNSIAAFSYTPSCDKNNSGFNERFDRYDSFKSDFLNGIRIIGQATLQNGDILLMIPADSGGYNQSLFVKLTDILKNGGVSHSHLTHSYRAFLLARKELSMAIEKMLFNSQEFIKMLSPIKLKKGTWVQYMATYDYAYQTYVLDEDTVFSCVGITPHGFFLYRDKVLCHRANVGGAKPESLRLIYAYMDKGQIQI